MNSNKCENIMDKFYSLDKGEHLPFSASGHLLCCKECRTKVRLLTKAEKIIKRPLREIQTFDSDEIAQIIRNTTPGWMDKVKPVSFTKWAVCGLLMTVFFIFSGHYIGLVHDDYETYQFWFYLIFALSVSAYCSAFVAANMDFFVKKIDTKKTV